jgi:isopenicillin N synthase-like dioxygenase
MLVSGGENCGDLLGCPRKDNGDWLTGRRPSGSIPLVRGKTIGIGHHIVVGQGSTARGKDLVFRSHAPTLPPRDRTRLCQHSCVIPVISVAELDTHPQSVGSAIIEAYASLGFAYVVDHSIDLDLQAEVFEMSRRFHALPEVDKRRIEVNRFHRGYVPFATSTDRTSTLGEAKKPNLSESFLMLREVSDDHLDVRDDIYLAGPNQWPAQPAGFRQVVTAYNQSLGAFALQIISAIDQALGTADSITRWFDEPTTWLRLLHYPPQDPQAPEDEFGSAPHTDFGAITLLAQDDVGGLSVSTPQGAWADVPPLPGAFVMNVGDVLHRWSGGRMISTPHRVTNRSGMERYSIPFFFDPSMRAPLDLDDPTGATFGDYVRHHLEGSYDQHKVTP